MRTLPVIRQSPGDYSGVTHVGRAGYYDDFHRLVMVGYSEAMVRANDIQVFGAEIRDGRPWLHARLKIDGEWKSPFVWYPSWDQYDRFWCSIRR